MQGRRQKWQAKGTIIGYNSFLCKIYDLETGIKIINYNQILSIIIVSKIKGIKNRFFSIKLFYKCFYFDFKK